MSEEKAISPALSSFVERLRQAALALNLTVEDKPALASTFFSGGVNESTSLSPTDLPSQSIAIRIDRFNIVVGVLPDVPTIEAVQEVVRRYRNQCVVARSFLSANEALDLQLMLLGPRGSEQVSAWQALGLVVERDDRVARKFAWLTPDDSTRDDESFANFLKRTFLARPWAHKEGEFEDAALDALSAGVAATSELPQAITDEWDRIALGQGKDPDEIVAALVKAWGKRGEV
jgi:hypothetical protein